MESATGLMLIDDIEQCHRLFQEALTGCDFDGRCQTERRADTLKAAATLARYTPTRDAAQLDALQTWRAEMGSLLKLTIEEGRTKRQAADVLGVILLEAPPANLIEAFREADHLQLVLGTPPHRGPGFALRQQALAELEAIRPEHADDANALPAVQAAIAAARRLHDEADRVEREPCASSRPPSPAQRARFDAAGTNNA
ncbi:hypothetical protein CDN99_04315 [Roseateles aquatilis]|uniref:Uncharacterized protein n=2 Tax=Roseateles aquatilis TaxID=431061 RepID=A0A246JM48_9BURK|nr:hypothetical protein CDN99_04315 [Roseateles aquatilis]